MTDIGTGSYTVIAQTAAEMMGVRLERVVVRLGDSNFPVSCGSGGQWGGNSATAGVYAACVKLREAVAQKAGLECRRRRLRQRPGARRFAVHSSRPTANHRFRMMMHSIPTGQLYGSTTRGEQIEVSVNGERKALLDINPRMSESDPKGISIETEPIFVKAGPQRVSAAFIARSESPVDDLIAPIDYTLADTQIGSALGITTLPHLRELEINGPHKVTGVSDTVSRRRVFICRPTTPAEEAPCAEKIVRQLATTAFRRPVSGDEVKGLLGFYDDRARRRATSRPAFAKRCRRFWRARSSSSVSSARRPA